MTSTVAPTAQPEGFWTTGEPSTSSTGPRTMAEAAARPAQLSTTLPQVVVARLPTEPPAKMAAKTPVKWVKPKAGAAQKRKIPQNEEAAAKKRAAIDVDEEGFTTVTAGRQSAPRLSLEDLQRSGQVPDIVQNDLQKAEEEVRVKEETEGPVFVPTTATAWEGDELEYPGFVLKEDVADLITAFRKLVVDDAHCIALGEKQRNPTVKSNNKSGWIFCT